MLHHVHVVRDTADEDARGGTDEKRHGQRLDAVSYTHLRAHETPEHLVCRLLLEKKKKKHIPLTDIMH